MNDRQSLELAGRVEALGVEIRSAELRETLSRHQHFAEHGNRQLRRAHQRAQRRKGHR